MEVEAQPGAKDMPETALSPPPEVIRPGYKGSAKLKGKVAIVTGADSGIGRSVAVHFAREGCAAVVVCYHSHTEDAEETKRMVIEEGTACKIMGGDVGDSAFCNSIIEETIKEYGRIDVLVNNAAEQHPVDDITKMDPATIQRTFKTNIYSQIYLCRAAWPHLKRGASIINVSSVNAYKGHGTLLDYTATKGAITAFSRALALSAVSSGIRVNSKEDFGKATPMQRPGEPAEVAPSLVFLASEDASYISGQALHPNGGRVVNA
ncbi:hypothetical protein HYH03_004988 [Edaphochlamys debaryana]|uniref:Uncharacterized protein n=1 Tax=Edaphochlamys debaryana TaxID=47281 RepID=A0A835Y600_9CHLO|nr:hypothetical protein HYH03_004988 [Edaphochlamys debaryana]|eukprot:KAG2496982.1 hypothetical protein HYH03_004988 [Edaphochlamys debaryana]